MSKPLIFDAQDFKIVDKSGNIYHLHSNLLKSKSSYFSALFECSEIDNLVPLPFETSELVQVLGFIYDQKSLEYQIGSWKCAEYLGVYELSSLIARTLSVLYADNLNANLIETLRNADGIKIPTLEQLSEVAVRHRDGALFRSLIIHQVLSPSSLFQPQAILGDFLVAADWSGNLLPCRPLRYVTETTILVHWDTFVSACDSVISVFKAYKAKITEYDGAIDTGAPLPCNRIVVMPWGECDFGAVKILRCENDKFVVTKTMSVTPEKEYAKSRSELKTLIFEPEWWQFEFTVLHCEENNRILS
jgi:hypothetical protein